MNIEVEEAQNEIRRIRISLTTGKLTYKEAKEKAQPHIDVLNEKGREVAKRFKRRHNEITFSGIMR